MIIQSVLDKLKYEAIILYFNTSILLENYDKIYYVQTLFKLESNRHTLKI